MSQGGWEIANKNKSLGGGSATGDARPILVNAEQLIAAGRVGEAEGLVREALERVPSSVEARAMLGRIAFVRGDYPNALKRFEELVIELPRNPVFKSFRAFTLLKVNRPEEARAEAEAVLIDYPNFIHALKVLANYWVEKQDFSQVETFSMRALESDPADGDALGLYGLACVKLNRDEEARIYLKRAIKLNPRRSDVFQLIGSTYRNQCRFRTACSYMRFGYRLDSDSREAAVNYATLLGDVGQVHEALEIFRRTLEKYPDDPLIRFNMSLLLLLIGQLQEGWALYEARRERRDMIFRDVALPYPDWRGESLVDKTLLILSEQGIGDEIWAAGTFDDVLKLGGTCMIECDARLASLYRRSFPTAVIVPRASQSSINIPPAPSVDYKILALSLPYRLRSRWEQFPGRVGYLVPESSLREYWRWRLAQLGSGLKVGISWRSGMMKGTRHDNYTVLDEWGDVFGVPNAVFVNLQYGQCQDELDAAAEMFGVEIVNFEHIDLKNDFEQLAALMSELDVVIAPSNAVAALGGALNVPVLEFLPNNNWIRLGKDYDPWYPSVSLFFRPWDQDWSGVMYAIAVEILRRSKAKVSESVSENALHEGAVVRQRLARAALLLQKGNVDNARAICEDLLTVRPDHAEALLLLGVAQQKGGESGKAEETYKKVVEIEPLYAEAFNYLGALYLGSRRFAEAEEQLNRALELRPAFNDALNNLGVAYAARRMFDKAIECYRRAIAMSAGDATARYNLALALEDTGQADEAIVEYQTVLDGNEAHVDAWNNLGNLYGRVGRISESETAFRKAIDVAPDFAAARINLARLLLREGRGSQEAIEHLRKAVALRPGDAGILNMLGVAYAAMGCPDEAAEQFERALTIAPGFLDAVRNLGSILQQSGRLEEAKAVLLKGLSHQPTGSDH